MAVGGYNWGDWAFLDYSSETDIDAVAVADAASLTSDEFSLDNLAACEIGVTTVEDNTGACDGDVVIHLLGKGATDWQAYTDDPVQVERIDQVQNTTKHANFFVSAEGMGSFKVLVYNDCGQEVAVSIKIRTATFDSA